MEHEKIRFFQIWLVPIFISLILLFFAQKHSLKKNGQSEDRYQFDPFFTLLLPICLWYINHPILIAFFRQKNSDHRNALHQNLVTLYIHLILVFAFGSLCKITHFFDLVWDIPYYWAKAGLFFNLTMILMQLLPWPPFLIGNFLFSKNTKSYSDLPGLILSILCVTVIPANVGFGQILYPLYHVLINFLT